MLRRISVKDAQAGMYVQKVEGPWLNHPFWKSSFLLYGDRAVARLQESGIEEVWIDTERGLDLDGAEDKDRADRQDSADTHADAARARGPAKARAGQSGGRTHPCRAAA
jgi:hypothetical protein